MLFLKATVFLGRLPYASDCKIIRQALQQLSQNNSSNRFSGRPRRRSREDRYTSNQSRDSRRSRSPFAGSPASHGSETEDLNGSMEHGVWPKIRLVRDMVTGFPRGYGFAYFRSADEADHVLRSWLYEVRSHTDKRNQNLGGLNIPGGEKVILEPAFSETLPGWKPRRLGGGLGGRKESGQLRFGGVARPFRRPFNT
ncbi:U11/U12 small nuclear ribonucleoprotein 35 kDa protein [Fasciola gigantica]|uniref:U11/U12 small nuclear ribonucleoprotein 35 kDa protein n=1 Tax=Fasciola gigantica TaxID=46835 RepID=A0A504YC35_FASGI|nr:U11/U12 small nuclear ribonucleoprotein 35 kDa protein [Fasciola gigantica]